MASNRLWGDRKEKIVILDTSAILTPFEFSINLEQEIQKLIGSFYIVVPKQIEQELVTFSKHKEGKKSQMAKAALQLIKNYEIIYSDEKKADDAILQLAKETNAIVVTNDRELRKRLKKIQISVIFLRARKKFVLE